MVLKYIKNYFTILLLLTSIVTSKTDPSRSVTLAKAALPEEEDDVFFFVGVSACGVASADTDDLVSPGMFTISTNVLF